MTREGAIELAKMILAELAKIEAAIDEAIERCERSLTA